MSASSALVNVTTRSYDSPDGPSTAYNKDVRRSSDEYDAREDIGMHAFHWVSLSLLLSATRALSPAHLACQLKKPGHLSPLTGCNPGTIFVSQADSRAHFASVQAAILSLYVIPAA